jgi:hypothetical protein
MGASVLLGHVPKVLVDLIRKQYGMLPHLAAMYR